MFQTIRKRLKPFGFTRQFDQMDCGPACIRMVARYHGKDYPLSYLRTLAHLSREGVSTFRMSHFWKKRKALDYEYFKAAAQNRCL